MLHHIIPQPNDLRFTGGVCSAQRPLVIRDAAVPPEGYTLTVSKEGISIRCSTEKGRFYAAQTLRQLRNSDGTLPCCVISDAPRFAYRALMLDSARHMQTVDEIELFREPPLERRVVPPVVEYSVEPHGTDRPVVGEEFPELSHHELEVAVIALGLLYYHMFAFI